MFAQPSLRGSNPSKMFSSMYRQVGVETGVSTANPHQLVKMLYDGLLESIAQARGMMKSGDLEGKGRAISRASRIIEEGLKASLNPAGGELTSHLSNLYGYLITRLMQAHLRNDVAALDECQRLVEPLREAWVQIGAQVST